MDMLTPFDADLGGPASMTSKTVHRRQETTARK